MTLDPTHGQMVFLRDWCSFGGRNPDCAGSGPGPSRPPLWAHSLRLAWADAARGAANCPGPYSMRSDSAMLQCASCPKAGREPIDLSSGIDVITATDIAINGPRGRISIDRTLRTQCPAIRDPFGIWKRLQLRLPTRCPAQHSNNAGWESVPLQCSAEWRAHEQHNPRFSVGSGADGLKRGIQHQMERWHSLSVPKHGPHWLSDCYYRPLMAMTTTPVVTGSGQVTQIHGPRG